MKELIDRLKTQHALARHEYALLLDNAQGDPLEYANAVAREAAVENFGNNIYKRGLIETTNLCRNDCYYCGIRRSNANAARYRLTRRQTLECCRLGDGLGFKTFVLQGGEDPGTDDDTIQTIAEIRREFPQTAITLSLGERSRDVYRRFFDAGANRYLLRHETASRKHYAMLHPTAMSFDRRMEALRNLKEIGFQTGAGMMVGSPGQTTADLVEDIMFINAFGPEMVGVGPYIPQRDTPFAAYPAGSVERTLMLISIFRLTMPRALIPSTTALASLAADGRERGILAGANVVMPNLTPAGFRERYSIYDNKANSGSEAAEGLKELERRLAGIGYRLCDDRGDHSDTRRSIL